MPAIGAEIALVLAVAYSPWGEALFATSAVSWRVWAYAAPWAATLIVADALHKRFRAR